MNNTLAVSSITVFYILTFIMSYFYLPQLLNNGFYFTTGGVVALFIYISYKVGVKIINRKDIS